MAKASRVSILIPRPAIAACWNGALELRLRRAPLEVFLRSRALPCAAAGAAQVTDNLTAATVAIVSSGLTLYACKQQQQLLDWQLEELAQLACAVSEGLTALIYEPRSWRVVALLSAAQLLRAQMGPSSAAHLSASITHTFAARPNERRSLIDIGRMAARAVERNDAEVLETTSQVISKRLTEPQELAQCSLIAAAR